MTADLVSRWPLVGREPERSLLQAAVLGRARRGALIVGEAGVGKTRLADECAVLAEQAGWRVCRLVSTRGSRDVPLGVLFGLLPEEGPEAEANVVQHVVEQIRRLADEEQLLVVIDDANHLDAASAMVLSQVVFQGLASVVATVRSHEEVDNPLTVLWKDDHLARIDLAPLDHDRTEELARQALGGHLEGSTVRTLWEVTEGNPLYVRELLLGALDAELLSVTDGVWTLHGFPHSPRLAELVESRLEDTSDEQRALLEQLAVGEPLSLDMAERLADRSVIDALDRLGLLSLSRRGDRTELLFAHPVHGEVLRAGMSALRTLAISRDLADAADAVGGVDPLRTAIWRLDGGGQVEPGQMVTAARNAHFANDHHLAVRLARSALVAGGGVEAGIILGETLVALGDFEDANLVLADAAVLATEDEKRAVIAMNRAQALIWGLARPAESDTVLGEAVEVMADGPWRDAVLAMRAVNQLLGGRPLDAAASASPLLDRSDGRVRVEAATVVGPALAIAGRSAEAIAVAIRGYDDCVELGGQLAMAGPGLHLIARAEAEIAAGLVADATHTARRAYDEAIANQATDGQAWAALLRSRAALLAGRLDEADRFAAEGAMLFRSLGQPSTERWCLATHAWTAAHLGRHERAHELIDQLDAIEIDQVQMMEVDVERARAWVQLSSDSAGAIERFGAAGQRGLASGSLALAAGAFHDLVRVGRCDLACAPLTELAAEVDGRLMELRVAHAVAAAACDAQQLETTADEFELLGVLPLAADAMAQASMTWRADGRPRDARRAGERARALARACGGLATPAMPLAGPSASLTSREREVAMSAAGGRSNRDIASRLGLSVRTVENHLQRAYEKLGAANRDELTELLELTSLQPDD